MSHPNTPITPIEFAALPREEKLEVLARKRLVHMDDRSVTVEDDPAGEWAVAEIKRLEDLVDRLSLDLGIKNGTVQVGA